MSFIFPKNDKLPRRRLSDSLTQMDMNWIKMWNNWTTTENWLLIWENIDIVKGDVTWNLTTKKKEKYIYILKFIEIYLFSFYKKNFFLNCLVFFSYYNCHCRLLCTRKKSKYHFSKKWEQKKEGLEKYLDASRDGFCGWLLCFVIMPRTFFLPLFHLFLLSYFFLSHLVLLSGWTEKDLLLLFWWPLFEARIGYWDGQFCSQIGYRLQIAIGWDRDRLPRLIL